MKKTTNSLPFNFLKKKVNSIKIVAVYLLLIGLVVISKNVNAQTYCTPNGPSSSPYYITNVTFAGINNTSGDIPYNHYTAPILATVYSGCTYPLSITENSFTDYYAVWIDYNQDGTFTTSESVFNGRFGGTSPATVSTNLVIPAISASVVVGTTRMRVIHSFSAITTSDACTNPSASGGEVEDYDVSISNASAPSAPTSNAATVIVCTGFNANWTAVAGATSYQIDVSTNAGFTAPIAGSPFTVGAVTTYAVSGLTATTNYWYRVRALQCSASSGNSGIQSVTTGSICYCTPNFTSGCASYFINNFSFAGITNNGSGCSNNQLYSTTTGAVNQGCTYTLTAAGNGANTFYWNVWVDYNNDGTFNSTNESVYVGTGFLGSISVPITIPGTASLATTRVRVRARYNGSMAATDACTNIADYGETEDYLITVSGAVTTANAGSNQSIGCPNSTTLAGNNPTIGTGTWTVSTGSGTFANANLYNTTVSAIGGGANTYTWTIALGSCSNSSNVTITRSTAYSNAGPNQSICTATATLAGNNPVTTVSALATGTWTKISGSGAITAPSLYNSGVTGLSGTSVFRWSVCDNAGTPCTASADITIVSIATATFTGTGNWSDPTKWSTGTVPAACMDVTIASGICTVDGNFPCNNLTINSGATLTIGAYTLTSGANVTVNGTLDNQGKLTMSAGSPTFTIGNAGTYIHEPTLTPTAASSADMFVKGTKSFSATSNVIIKSWYSATTGLATNMTGNYGNLTIDANSGTPIDPAAGNANWWFQGGTFSSPTMHTIQGNLTIGNAVIVLHNNSGTTGYTGTYTLSVTGNIILNNSASIFYGLLHFNNAPITSSAANVTITCNNLNITAGSFYMVNNLALVTTVSSTGAMNLTATTGINVTGGKFYGGVSGWGAQPGGVITITAPSITLNNASFYGAQDGTPTSVNILASSGITLSNNAVLYGTYSTVLPANAPVTISNAAITISTGTRLCGAYTAGIGAVCSGNVAFNNLQSITISGTGIFNGNYAGSGGVASGTVSVTCPIITMTGGTFYATDGGTGTSISVTSANAITLSGSSIFKGINSYAATQSIGNFVLTQSTSGTIALDNNSLFVGNDGGAGTTSILTGSTTGKIKINVNAGTTATFTGSIGYSNAAAPGTVSITSPSFTLAGGSFTGNQNGTGNTTIFSSSDITLSGTATFTGAKGLAATPATGTLSITTGNINLNSPSVNFYGGDSWATGTITIVSTGIVNISDGIFAIRRDQGAATMTINSSGSFIQSGGTFYLYNNAATFNASAISMTVNGDFTQTDGTLNFDDNTNAGGGTRTINVAGSNYTLDYNTNANMTRAITTGTVLYGALNFSNSGRTLFLRNDSRHQIQQINQTINSGTTLDITGSPNNFQIASFPAPDTLALLVNGVLDMGNKKIYGLSVSDYYSGIKVGSTGTLRTRNVNGFYDGSQSACIKAKVFNASINYRMDYSLDAASTVEYYGNSDLVITGIGYGINTSSTASKYKYGNLNINITTSTKFAYPVNKVNVRTQLNLVAGELNLNGNGNHMQSGGGGQTIFIENPSSTAIVRTAGYIRSELYNNSGKVKWFVSNNAGAYVFPFGARSGNANYIPFTFNLTAGTADTVTISTYNSGATPSSNLPTIPIAVANINDKSGNDNSNNTVERFWQIDKTGASGTADLTFAYTNGEEPANGSNQATNHIQAQRWNSGTGKWDGPKIGQSFTKSTPTVSGSFTVPGITSFSPWTGAVASSPLPIELVSFNAVAVNKEVDLNWITATEINNASFTIERSLDGISFDAIAKQKGAGNSLEKLSYKAIDNNPYIGTMSYYRLKQTDYNGNSTYSELKTVLINNLVSGGVKVNPNPVNMDIATASILSSTDENGIISVYDSKGVLVNKSTVPVKLIKGVNNLPLNTANFEAGLYLLKITTDTHQFNTRFLKQ